MVGHNRSILDSIDNPSQFWIDEPLQVRSNTSTFRSLNIRYIVMISITSGEVYSHEKWNFISKQQTSPVGVWNHLFMRGFPEIHCPHQHEGSATDTLDPLENTKPGHFDQRGADGLHWWWCWCPDEANRPLRLYVVMINGFLPPKHAVGNQRAFRKYQRTGLMMNAWWCLRCVRQVVGDVGGHEILWVDLPMKLPWS